VPGPPTVILLLAAQQSAAPGDALATWQREIEEIGGGLVLVTRIAHDAGKNLLILPDDTPHRAVARRFFLQPGFVSSFNNAHALTVNYDGPGRRLHFIFLNMRLAGEWRHAETSLLAHEYGHAWLDARGYKRPGYQDGPRACLSIHGGDIVQHPLIRTEVSRRGLSQDDYLVPNLEKALEQLEQRGPPEAAPPCQRAFQLSLWVNVRLGVTGRDWPKRDRFLSIHEKSYPALTSHVEEICRRIESMPAGDAAAYGETLSWVLERMESLFGAP